MTPAGDVTERDRLPSPALLVDLDRFEENIRAAERLIHPSGKALRPHVKAHKTPELALLQASHCARGVTCATVGEAEAMVDGGIVDVLLANEFVSLDKVDRIARLAGRARVIVATDSELGVELLSAAVTRQRTSVEVLVDIDVGMGRCGVRSSEDAVRLAQQVLKAPGLRLNGLMGYEGRLRARLEDRSTRLQRACASLEHTKSALQEAGIPVETISGAGTSTFMEALTSPVLTEIQAGTYAFMEADLDGLGLPFALACAVSATVISAWAGGAVLDAGRKSITIDAGLPRVSLNGATVVAVNEEHTVVHTPTPPPLATRVLLTPSKVPTTFNLHDRIWLIRGATVERSVPVAARGRSD